MMDSKDDRPSSGQKRDLLLTTVECGNELIIENQTCNSRSEIEINPASQAQFDLTYQWTE